MATQFTPKRAKLVLYKLKETLRPRRISGCKPSRPVVSNLAKKPIKFERKATNGNKELHLVISKRNRKPYNNCLRIAIMLYRPSPNIAPKPIINDSLAMKLPHRTLKRMPMPFKQV